MQDVPLHKIGKTVQSNDSTALVSPGRATNMTQLSKLLQCTDVREVVYCYAGTVIEDVEVKALLAESRHVRKDGSIRRRMMVQIPDILWLQLTRLLIERDDSLSLYRRLGDSTLLTFRDRTEQWASSMFDRFEVGELGRLYEANSCVDFWSLVQMAANDNYPSLSGQPLFLLSSYKFGERYEASIEDGRLLIHIPESIVREVKLKLEQSMKYYL